MCEGDVKCILHVCKTFIFILPFFLCLLPSILFFCMLLVFFFLPPSFSQPACRCLQTTWRLTVICSRFPKPTIWAKKKLTGLRSHAPAHDTTAVIQLGGADTVSSTPTMIMMSLLRKTCGPRMSTAMQGDILHPVTTGTMAALADIHPHHVIQMSQGPWGHLRRTQKTHQCAMTLQDDPHLQEGVATQGLAVTTLLTTPEIHLGITTASAPPDRETHTAPHAASLSQGTCRANHQVLTGHVCLYCNNNTFALSWPVVISFHFSYTSKHSTK